MNLATMTPAKQVAHILAHTAPGAMPDIPPFLKVDAAEAARRKAWNATHPLPPQAKFLERSSKPTVEDDAWKQRAAADREAVANKKAARLATFKQSKAQEWVMSLPEEDRRWSTRLGRFIPECIPGLERMPLADALKAIESTAAKAEYRTPEATQKRAIKHRVEAASKSRHARPTPKAAAPTAPSAPRKAPVVGKVTGPEADVITLEMLRRPNGVTQAQLAERLGSTGDAARGRISKVARGNHLNVSRSKEGVYSIAK